MDDKTALGIKDIAAELGISEMQAHKLISKGRLPAVDIGTGKRSFWRVERSDFDKYLADQKATTARRFEQAS